jgi:hypothetical protein
MCGVFVATKSHLCATTALIVLNQSFSYLPLLEMVTSSGNLLYRRNS